MTAMSVINNIIALFLAGQSFMDHSRMLRSFLTSIAAILGLFLILAMMLGTLVIGGLYAGYLALLAHEWTTYQALGIIGGILAVLIASVGALLAVRLKRLRAIPLQTPFQQSPITSRVTDIGQAFMDGFLKKA